MLASTKSWVSSSNLALVNDIQVPGSASAVIKGRFIVVLSKLDNSIWPFLPLLERRSHLVLCKIDFVLLNSAAT